MNILNSAAGQEIRITDRSRLSVNCVEDVTSFDENSIIVKTGFGMLAVDGKELRITALNTDTGELFVEGDIGGVVFFGEESPKKKRGLFGR